MKRDERRGEIVVLTVRLRAEERHLTDLLDSLRRIGGPTLAHQQCRYFGAFRSAGEPVEVILLEEWDSLRGLDAHFRSPDFKVVLSVMDSAVEAPLFRIDTVRDSMGFERVEEALNGPSERAGAEG